MSLINKRQFWLGLLVCTGIIDIDVFPTLEVLYIDIFDEISIKIFNIYFLQSFCKIHNREKGNLNRTSSNSSTTEGCRVIAETARPDDYENTLDK